jgi:chromosome segregation ATPase
LHEQQEEAERREKDLKRDFELLERQDIMINSEKKHKLVEISKTEKQIAEYEREKQEMIDRNTQIQQELPQLESSY